MTYVPCKSLERTNNFERIAENNNGSNKGEFKEQNKAKSLILSSFNSISSKGIKI